MAEVVVFEDRFHYSCISVNFTDALVIYKCLINLYSLTDCVVEGDRHLYLNCAHRNIATILITQFYHGIMRETELSSE
jgi:hypothetical protein